MKNTNLILNGKVSKSKTISKMIQAFSNSDILNTYGGYIFTFRIHNNIQYLGIKPAIIEGQRSNHFNLNAGPDTKIFLTGNINPNGEISLLFKLSQKEMNTGTASELQELYIQFASLLITNSYQGAGNLEWVTKKILEESELFQPVPMTIYEMCK